MSTMKRILTLLATLCLLPLPAFAAPFVVGVGGTGWGNLQAGYLLYGNGTSPVATSSSLFWNSTYSRLQFTNASSTNQNISNDLWLTNLGTAAGTFLAVDPNGLVIATSTPTATPGGSDTQVQYNKSGAFAGDSGMTYNDSLQIFSAKVVTAANVARFPIITDTGSNIEMDLNSTRFNIAATGGSVGIASSTPWKLLSVGSSNTGTFAISTTTGGCATFSPNGELYSTGSNCGLGTVTSVTGTWPVISSGGTTPAISWAGLSTSSNLTNGQVLYATGVKTLQSVATTTLSVGGPLNITSGRGTLIGGSNATIGWSGLATTTNLSASQILYAANGTTGVTTAATTTLSGTGGISVSNSPYVIGGSGAVISCSTCTLNGVTAVTGTWPMISSGGTTPNFTFGWATTSQPSSSNLFVSNGTNGFYGVATSSSGTASTIVALNASQFTTLPNASTTNLTAKTYFAAPTTTATSTPVGGLFVNISTASSSIRDCTSSSCYSWFDTFDKPTIYASSTLAYDGAYSGSATTSYMIWRPSHNAQLVSIDCVTDVGTVWYEVGNGSASTTVQCTTSGASAASTVSLPMKGRVYEALGHEATNPNQITVTPTYRYTAD